MRIRSDRSFRSLAVRAGVVSFLVAAGFGGLVAASSTVASAGPLPITTTTVLSSANPSSVGQTVTFTATTGPLDLLLTPAGNVSWVDNGAGTLAVTPLSGPCLILLSTCTSTFTTSALPAGTNVITATFNGDLLAAASTGTITQNVVAPNGQVVVANVAPAGADQNVTFNFQVSCPAIAGSPFAVNILGSGTGVPITLPAGTQCTASETPQAGFVSQPSQAFPPVVAGQVQEVTFSQVDNNTQGFLVISNSAPAGADQNANFNFGIFCNGVAGSPFTENIRGSGTSVPLSLPAGTNCIASESVQSGFVPQSNQTFPAVVAGATQTVAFNQVDQGGPPTSGNLVIHNNAPAGADQSVQFNFGIYCSGVTGSPFTENITGTGDSVALSLPGGTSGCIASESQMPNFVVQQNQSYATVVAGQTQTLTFNQQDI